MLEITQRFIHAVKKNEKGVLIGLMTFLLIMHVISALYITFTDFDGSVKYLFFFDHEYNVPTYFTTLLWFLMAFRLIRNYKDYLLASIATFLGLDESFLIHDRFTDIVRDAFNSTENEFFEDLARFPFAWVFVGFFVMIPIIYIFWTHSKRISNKYLIRGILIFFLGAIGVEIIGSFFVLLMDNTFTPGHINQIIYTGIVTVEESLEITGLMVALYGLGDRFSQGIEQEYESSNRPRLFPPIRWSRKGS